MSVYVCVSYIVSLPKKPHLNERQSSGKWRGQGEQWDRETVGQICQRTLVELKP